MAKKKVPGLRIVARRDKFRRCGRAWSAKATDVPLSAFTKAQIATLRNEPQLVVADCEIEIEAEAEAEDGGKPKGGTAPAK